MQEIQRLVQYMNQVEQVLEVADKQMLLLS